MLIIASISDLIVLGINGKLKIYFVNDLKSQYTR